MYNQNQIGVAQNNAVAAPKAQPEIAYAAQVLDSALSRLEARSVELYQRLAPVVEERPQSQGGVDGKAERQMFSAVGRGVMETVYRIESVEQRINVLLDTLAI